MSKTEQTRTPRTRKVAAQNFSLAQRHLGLIAQRALFYHRFLPAWVRNHYDPDDMIADVVLHVVKKSAQFVAEYDGERTFQVMTGSGYDASRAKDNTWVWHVADNQCKAILSHYSTQQYTACDTIEISPEVELHLSAQSSVQARESRNAVERVIEMASDAALELLDSIFNGRAPEVPDPAAVENLREAAKRCSARFSDFQSVYRTGVA